MSYLMARCLFLDGFRYTQHDNPPSVGLFKTRITRPFCTSSVLARELARRSPCRGGHCCKSIATVSRILGPPEWFGRCLCPAARFGQVGCTAQYIRFVAACVAGCSTGCCGVSKPSQSA